jgi:glycosyltransferase involved in cell wall biosynthesis
MLNKSGIGRYIRDTLAGLAAVNDSLQYILSGDPVEIRLFLDENPYLSQKVIGIRPFRSPVYSAQEQLCGHLFLKYQDRSAKRSVDLFHFPHYNVPYFFPGSFVVTIHDLIHSLFPEYFGVARVRLATIILCRSLSHAKLIIAVSESTAADIERAFPGVAAKVRVVHEYASSFFAPQPVADVISFKKNNNLVRYLLYVGNRKPHKNITRLVKAFQILKKDFPDLQLVLLGKRFTAEDEVDRLLQALKIDDVIEVDQCSDEELRYYYCGAEALILPSLYEGFGLPVLEAMACATPVCVSRAASLPEVVGDAGLYFDPCSIEEMARSIYEILSNQDLYQQLKMKGIARSRLFTKESSSLKTIAVYREALESR